MIRPRFRAVISSTARQQRIHDRRLRSITALMSAGGFRCSRRDWVGRRGRLLSAGANVAAGIGYQDVDRPGFPHGVGHALHFRFVGDIAPDRKDRAAHLGRNVTALLAPSIRPRQTSGESRSKVVNGYSCAEFDKVSSPGLGPGRARSRLPRPPVPASGFSIVIRYFSTFYLRVLVNRAATRVASMRLAASARPRPAMS